MLRRGPRGKFRKPPRMAQDRAARGSAVPGSRAGAVPRLGINSHQRTKPEWGYPHFTHSGKKNHQPWNIGFVIQLPADSLQGRWEITGEHQLDSRALPDNQHKFPNTYFNKNKVCFYLNLRHALKTTFTCVMCTAKLVQMKNKIQKGKSLRIHSLDIVYCIRIIVYCIQDIVYIYKIDR